MIQAHFELDEASLPLSSPRSSPKRPLYFVQSPSRDSHNGEKLSSRTTPGYGSPMDSPSHSSPFPSSASRFSGSFNPWKLYRKRSGKGWPRHNVTDEEGQYDDGEHTGRRLRFYAVLGLVLVFMVICLIIWGASRPYKPQIDVKHLKVNNFYVGVGTDHTGVPTMVMTLNCSVKMVIYNPATFFDIHISSTPLHLFYSEIMVATGQLKKYHQPRKSQRVITVYVEGKKVPLYGAGASLPTPGEIASIPLRLEFEILSRANLVGKLVKTRHRRHISCTFVFNSSATKAIKFKDDSCHYK